MVYRWWQKILLLIIIGLVIYSLINSKWFLKMFYPFPHREVIVKCSQEYKMDPYLVAALIRTESRFYSRAQSQAGARGLMQIMPKTASWIAEQMKLDDYNEEKLYDPLYNIPMGIWYLAYLDKTFDSDWPKMLAAYNAGESKVKKWINEKTWTGELQDIAQIPFAETREYIDKVLFAYQIYKKIYS